MVLMVPVDFRRILWTELASISVFEILTITIFGMGIRVTLGTIYFLFMMLVILHYSMIFK